MAPILLDSTVVIDYLRGRPAVHERLRSRFEAGDDLLVCAITVEEVSRGIRPREEDVFLELLDGLLVAPLGVAEGRLAGFWRRSGDRRGRTFSQSDALIAAAAVGAGASVATGNPKDFTMKGVTVEHWPVGA
jgi:predicted nucleic acid-binding protein